MSFSSIVTADGATTGIFLETFGETVTRRILGASGNTEQVTAIVELDNEEEGAGPVHNSDRTKIERYGTLEVAAAQAVDDRDQWVIASQLWKTVRIGGRDDGMKSVRIVRKETIRTTHGGAEVM